MYLSYDGDGCGKKVGRAIMANDEQALHEISAKIDLGHEIVKHWVAKQGGKVISGGGDEGSFTLPKDAIAHIGELRKDYHFATGITISVGCGRSLSEAGRSLLAAKFRGKDQVAFYDESVEKDIRKARSNVKKGKASQEEYKLAEAYLEKAENMANEQKPAAAPEQHVDCKFCEQSDGLDPTHCRFCHQNDDKMSDGCPFCEQNNGGAAAGADCPYCKESAAGTACPFCAADPSMAMDSPAQGPKQPEIASMDDHAAEQIARISSPDSTNESAPAGSPEEKEQANAMGMNPPLQGKPEIGDNSPAGVGAANPADAGAPLAEDSPNQLPPSQTKQPITDEGAHSKEALQTIAQQIETETVEGNPEDKAIANQTDDTQIVGNEMEGNVSRPGGYEANTPADTGLDGAHPTEESNEPDLSGVLKEGLDDHANTMQQEKARTMIGQALQGFKANKQFLEQAKTANPGFYAASIAMLAAMINMADMLGLRGPMAAQPGAPGEGQAGIDMEAAGQAQAQAGEENDWHDPFPTHPDKGGQQKPGHHAAAQGDAAQDPKNGSPVGQPIGKLPSKNTTKHVARNPYPPGAINEKGQQKVIDPKTGKTRWIDRKQGMVQSPTGVPIKPPKAKDENEQQQPKG
jgi:hypothetical protein